MYLSHFHTRTRVYCVDLSVSGCVRVQLGAACVPSGCRLVRLQWQTHLAPLGRQATLRLPVCDTNTNNVLATINDSQMSQYVPTFLIIRKQKSHKQKKKRHRLYTSFEYYYKQPVVTWSNVVRHDIFVVALHDVLPTETVIHRWCIECTSSATHKCNPRSKSWRRHGSAAFSSRELKKVMFSDSQNRSIYNVFPVCHNSVPSGATKRTEMLVTRTWSHFLWTPVWTINLIIT